LKIFDFRAMRSTASTLFQTHGTFKDPLGSNAASRSGDYPSLLREYVKVIPENQRKAVSGFERSVMKTRRKRRSEAENRMAK